MPALPKATVRKLQSDVRNSLEGMDALEIHSAYESFKKSSATRFEKPLKPTLCANHTSKDVIEYAKLLESYEKRNDEYQTLKKASAVQIKAHLDAFKDAVIGLKGGCHFTYEFEGELLSSVIDDVGDSDPHCIIATFDDILTLITDCHKR